MKTVVAWGKESRRWPPGYSSKVWAVERQTPSFHKGEKQTTERRPLRARSLKQLDWWVPPASHTETAACHRGRMRGSHRPWARPNRHQSPMRTGERAGGGERVLCVQTQNGKVLRAPKWTTSKCQLFALQLPGKFCFSRFIIKYFKPSEKL